LSQHAVILENAGCCGPQTASELAQRVSQTTVIRCNEPLAKHTTLRVGGPADIYVEPASEPDLAAVLACCHKHGWQLFVVGRGSNLLVRDHGFRGVVISLAQAQFSRIELTGERLSCGAGAKLKMVAVEAKRNALAGLEFLEGIPGSLGGGLRMNAGALGGALFDVVESVRLMSLDGIAHERTAQNMTVAYRSCLTLKDHVATSAILRGKPGSREEIEQRMNEFSHKRWQSQPAAPSAGCMFKNPGPIPAGKLIDEMGLKGTRIGGAVVSTEHGNFIVNDGTATARDVLELVEIIRQRVRAERGIELETEVEIIGE
jgi:UDP-N-acetylenolpyruvoylglucosamine reductase